MTTAIGFPTLRLIRHAIGGFSCHSPQVMSEDDIQALAL